MPELTQDWETDSGRAQTESCVDQEKGVVTPQKTDPDLPMSVQESPAEAWFGAACCRVGGTECSRAWDLLKEVAIIFITSTIVWPQVT